MSTASLPTEPRPAPGSVTSTLVLTWHQLVFPELQPNRSTSAEAQPAPDAGHGASVAWPVTVHAIRQRGIDDTEEST